jgi:hypothetical protein
MGHENPDTYYLAGQEIPLAKTIEIQNHSAIND